MARVPEIVTDQPAAFNKSWKRIRKLLIPMVMSDEPPNIVRMNFKEERTAQKIGTYTIELEFFEMSTRKARL